jgi:hypothetical protein
MHTIYIITIFQQKNFWKSLDFLGAGENRFILNTSIE